jgi:general secretion pathway protein J
MLEHFPEKWTPVFRRKCDQTNESRAHPGSLEPGCALGGKSPEAGFTLIETLIAIALFLLVIASLATVTAQWLPNWDRGFARAQRAEQLAFGIERVIADVSAAEFISPNAKVKNPIFDGTELSVTFVRSAVGPNSRPGLEFVRLAEIASPQGPVLARATAPFVPLEPDASAIIGLTFTEPVVLVRSPLRIAFSYAGPDRVWQPTWRGADQLPGAVRVSVRDAASGQILAVSSAATLHVNAPAACVAPKVQKCADVFLAQQNDAPAPPQNRSP